MSVHSYTKCWLHITWATLNREKFLNTVDVRKQLSHYLYNYASERNVFMKKNFVNSDHVHILVDLPTSLSLEELMHLLKGSSSHWINQNKFLSDKFSWGRGYGAFSVSDSHVKRVCNYIEGQEEHHRKKSFLDEYGAFLDAHGMKFVEDES